MDYLGDFLEDAIVYGEFNTIRFSSGAPFTLADTPSLQVYKADGTTQSTAGITLTVDFDSLTGLNTFVIDTSADAFYAVGNDYKVVIAAGTVDSVSWVGRVVGHFSIENRTIKANVVSVNDVAVGGVGTSADPWGPA